jgi:peptidoglycan/LPS O-acetylase OafA/YrhL
MSVTTADRDAVRQASGGQPNRWLGIDGLRGVAALALLTTHVAMVQGLIGTKQLGSKMAPSNFIGGFFTSGFQIFAGVFFVMTGLLIYRPYAKAIINGTPTLGRGSLLRRGLRLLPAYWAMCLVALFALNLSSIHSAWYVLRPLLLLQVYDWGGWINGLEITWTVPDMVQFYLLLPVLAWATHRYASGGLTARARAYRLMIPVPFMMVIGFAWLFFVKATNMGTRALFWWPMGLLPEVAIGMAVAILLALHQASPKDNPKVFRVAARHPNMFLLVAVVALVVNCARPFSEIGMDDIYTVGGLVLFYVLLALFGACLVVPLVAPGADSRLIRAVFTNPPILFLARISYGVYLWQFAVMHFYLQSGHLFGGHPKPIVMLRYDAGFWELELVTLIGSVIMATISYYLLERPLMDWGERYLRRREQRRTGVVVESRRESVPIV